MATIKNVQLEYVQHNVKGTEVVINLKTMASDALDEIKTLESMQGKKVRVVIYSE